uniref:Claspin n=1 Tax=Caenorhabditis tropicalis TaxID=1561998 RepID=A0A1I7UD34_9PELO
MESSTIPSSTDDTDSPSSITAEPTMSDSSDQVLSNENEEANRKIEEKRKLRRLERRKALALERSPLPPKLGGVLKSANNTIDLTNEDDDPSNKWFKKTFNEKVISKKTKSPELFAVPRHVSKNAPRSLIVKDVLNKKLQASLAVKRKKAQEERRKMYEEDNEHLKPDEEEEEEAEEEIVIRKKKAVKKEESDSEDDEDYKPPEERGEDDDDDGMSINLLNDSFTYNVFNSAAKRSGPGSVISNFDSDSTADPSEKVDILPTMSQIMGGSMPLTAGPDDILNLCSGKFEDFPDTLQMLLNEEKKTSEVPASLISKGDEADEEEEEEEVVIKKKTLTKKKDGGSDDEDDGLKSQDIFAPSEDAEDVSEAIATSEVHLTRIVISGDEDSDSDDPEEEEDVEEEEEEEEGEEENVEEEREEIEEEEPNFDDEDDELAVLKRIEHQEFKKQMKKRTLFDDEASLSGDDVGDDDVEDEDAGENLYEAEEGDADDVPDDATIRRQNFKMLLKQENDQETRALAKLQDRLLADGDLGGVETNRQFRFKLREEVEIQMNVDEEQQEEDEEPEEDEQKRKERAEMTKYRIEHAEELALLEETRDDDDTDRLFERAGKLLKRTEKIVVETTEEVHRNRGLLKPSLLTKTTLAVSFNEVLNAGAAPKQMYVQNFEKGTTGGSSRLSSGIKRAPTSPDGSNKAKRVRSSKLSSLE